MFAYFFHPWWITFGQNINPPILFIAGVLAYIWSLLALFIHVPEIGQSVNVLKEKECFGKTSYFNGCVSRTKIPVKQIGHFYSLQFETEIIRADVNGPCVKAIKRGHAKSMSLA